MSELVAAFVPVGVLVGVALGWYLRRVNSWCQECGRALSCSGCGRRPAFWPSPQQKVESWQQVEPWQQKVEP